MQISSQYRKPNTPKVHNFPTVRADRLHNAGGGLIRDNITFTTTDITSTINTHNAELQMVKVHINNTKHITIANMYIPARDSTSTHYKTADTDIQHCIQYITNIPHSVITGDESAHSTLWHSYTDDNRGQLIADIISNSDHISLNTKHMLHREQDPQDMEAIKDYRHTEAREGLCDSEEL